MYQYKWFTITRQWDVITCDNGWYVITFQAVDSPLYDDTKKKKSMLDEAKRRINRFLFSQ